MVKNHKNVQIMWKSTFKSTCNSMVKLCAKHKKITQNMEITFFPHTFPTFSTILLTTHPPLKIPHFSTFSQTLL